MLDIKIEYDGDYPNLCRGKLSVTINDTKYEFPEYCMDPGEYTWVISEWPKNFPEELKCAALQAINEYIEPSCCGGCS